MGYTTTFTGKLTLNRVLDENTLSELKVLHEYDPYRQEDPEHLKPKSYCQWVVTDDKKHLVWDGQEKFYYYVEWLQFIIDKLLIPKGYVLSGTLMAEGDEYLDMSRIIVQNNMVSCEILREKEVCEYKKKRGEKAKEKAGEVLCQTQAHYALFYQKSFLSLWDFLCGKMLRRRFSLFSLVLMREKSGLRMLYKVDSDDLNDRGEIRPEVLFSVRKYKHYIPVSNISRVVHYSSFLWKKLLRSENVYRIDTKYQSGCISLYDLKDDVIIREVIRRKASLLKRSHDFSLFLFVLRKIFLVSIFGFISLVSVLWCVAVMEALMISFSGILFASFFVVGFLYYFLVVKLLFPIFYYCFPLDFLDSTFLFPFRKTSIS